MLKCILSFVCFIKHFWSSARDFIYCRKVYRSESENRHAEHEFGENNEPVTHLTVVYNHCQREKWKLALKTCLVKRGQELILEHILLQKQDTPADQAYGITVIWY